MHRSRRWKRNKTTLSANCILLLMIGVTVCCDIAEAASKMSKKQHRSISKCLMTSNPVGCDTFKCLQKTKRCKFDGLSNLCYKFTSFADSFTKHGKRFIKKSLLCKASYLKANFQAWGRDCQAIATKINEMQGECYRNSSICRIASLNNKPLKLILPPNEVMVKRPSLQLFREILNCGSDAVLKFRDLIASIIGQSVLSTLIYLQDGSAAPLTDLISDMADRTAPNRHSPLDGGDTTVLARNIT